MLELRPSLARLTCDDCRHVRCLSANFPLDAAGQARLGSQAREGASRLGWTRTFPEAPPSFDRPAAAPAPGDRCPRCSERDRQKRVIPIARVPETSMRDLLEAMGSGIVADLVVRSASFRTPFSAMLPIASRRPFAPAPRERWPARIRDIDGEVTIAFDAPFRFGEPAASGAGVLAYTTIEGPRAREHWSQMGPLDGEEAPSTARDANPAGIALKLLLSSDGLKPRDEQRFGMLEHSPSEPRGRPELPASERFAMLELE